MRTKLLAISTAVVASLCVTGIRAEAQSSKTCNISNRIDQWIAKGDKTQIKNLLNNYRALFLALNNPKSDKYKSYLDNQFSAPADRETFKADTQKKYEDLRFQIAGVVVAWDEQQSDSRKCYVCPLQNAWLKIKQIKSLCPAVMKAYQVKYPDRGDDPDDAAYVLNCKYINENNASSITRNDLNPFGDLGQFLWEDLATDVSRLNDELKSSTVTDEKIKNRFRDMVINWRDFVQKHDARAAVSTTGNNQNILDQSQTAADLNDTSNCEKYDDWFKDPKFN